MVTITEQAWEAFHTPLHQFIRRRVADEAAAEDLLQDVFLKCCEQSVCCDSTNAGTASPLRPFLRKVVSSNESKREGCGALLVISNGKERMRK